MKFPNLIVVMTLHVFYINIQAETFDLIFNNKTRSKRGEIQGRAQIVDEGINNLLSLADKIESNIERPIQIALGNLIEVLKKPKAIAFRFIERFETNLKETTGNFIQRVNQPKEEASSLGIDISECVGDSNEKISSLPVHTLRLVTQCVMNRAQQSEDEILGAINSINASLAKAKDLFREVENCKEAFILKQGVCLGVVTVKVNLALLEIPLEVSNIYVKFSGEYIAAVWIPSLSYCSAGQLENLADEAGTVVKDVAFCVSGRYPDVIPLFRKMDETDRCETDVSGYSYNMFFIFKIFLILSVQFVCRFF